ncbi:MAG TPA: nucleotidyltransferase domain-containing protein [Kiritimatiellia bacterium]|nr:nucleotidyltransferase domain-containing protein [Kiritimatiellia bacterium]
MSSGSQASGLSPEISRDVSEELANFPDIQVCLVYGSAAAGRLRRGSDLDVAVAARERLGAEKRMSIQEALVRGLGVEVDVLDLQAVSGVILHQALTTGVLVFVRDHELYGDLISRMLFNQADMMPYVRRMMKERRDRFVA